MQQYRKQHYKSSKSNALYCTRRQWVDSSCKSQQRNLIDDTKTYVENNKLLFMSFFFLTTTII
jgi:hypothetical protein